MKRRSAVKTKVASEKKSKKKKVDKTAESSTAKVLRARITATVTCLRELDLARVNKSMADALAIGFQVDQDDLYTYQDGPQIDAEYPYEYDMSRAEDCGTVYRNVRRFYEKHHADFNWFDLEIETEEGVYASKWYVYRYENLGIVRRLEDVEKYKLFSHNRVNADVVKLGGKERVVDMRDSFVAVDR